jgi:hypothetical protein
MLKENVEIICNHCGKTGTIVVDKKLWCCQLPTAQGCWLV